MSIRFNRESSGSTEQYKACLVILSNMQIEVLDYHETFFDPVATMVTVCTLLTIVASKN